MAQKDRESLEWAMMMKDNGNMSVDNRLLFDRTKLHWFQILMQAQRQHRKSKIQSCWLVFILRILILSKDTPPLLPFAASLLRSCSTLLSTHSSSTTQRPCHVCGASCCPTGLEEGIHTFSILLPVLIWYSPSASICRLTPELARSNPNLHRLVC